MNDYIKQQLEDLDKKIEQNRQFLEDPEMGQLAKEEIANLEKQKKELEESTVHLRGEAQASPSTHLGGDADVNPNAAILEIRSAAGGDEAGIFASDLTRMYTRFAQNMNWKLEELDRSEGKLGQIKEIVLKIQGKDCYNKLKHESGVHRVQRVPVTESSGRIHTSTATVAVLPEVSEREIAINQADLEFEAFRSSGAGGQNVNKVSTAVRLKHIQSGIVVTSQTERSQIQNRENALQILRSKLWHIEQENKASTIGAERSAQVGTGERSEKIRTYNFPQNRVTDHRIGKSWHNLEEILNGKMDPIIAAFQ